MRLKEEGVDMGSQLPPVAVDLEAAALHPLTGTRWTRPIDSVLKVTLALALLGELGVVFFNTVSRSFFGSALLWTDETAQLALSTIAFLGGAFAYRRGEHASIGTLIAALPSGGQRACHALVDLVVLTVAVTTGLSALPLFAARWEELTPMLQMRAGWFVIPLMVSMVVIAVTAIERLLLRHRPTALAVSAGFAALVLLVAVTQGAWRPWFAGDAALTLSLGLFFGIVLIGLPVAFALFFGAFAYLYGTGAVPLTALAQNAADGTTNFVLVALPFFIFAGMIMQTGGISLRLVRFVHALVGHFRGGLLQVMVVSMYIVSGLSGAKTADVAAVGSVMRDMLHRQGYSLEQSAAVLAASAVMGETVPPSLAMLVLGSVTTLSVGALFIAGLIPAVVVALCLMALIYFQARQSDTPRAPRASLRQVAVATLGGLLPLLMPVILFAGILLGVGTPTEVSSFAVIYGLALSAIYGELGPRQLLDNVIDCAALSGMILFILAAASSFSWTLSVAHLPQRLVGILTGAHNNRWLFLFGSVLLLVVIGSILEGLPALLILAPILMPIASQVGVSQLHYGIILVIAMGIGIFIPPIGIGFYVCCAVCETTLEKSSRAMIPFLVVVCVGLLVVALVPWFTLFLPAKLHLGG
jgi:tripartite ATP-independent transporter DctM subunit